MTTKKIYLLLLTLVLLCRGYSQIFPVQATTQLVPPYSVYLPDYATGINNQLRVLLLNKDIAQPGYRVKLKMTIELNGNIIMRTSDFFNPSPIILEPNQPYSVEGTELAPYLNSNNIDFIGYSKQEYEQKKGLPEGAYKICFTAYDYVRTDNVKVSNEACSYYYLSKNDPPFVNTPACGMFLKPAVYQETLIERAGRWLCYYHNIPWNTETKNSWKASGGDSLSTLFQSSLSSVSAKMAISNYGYNWLASRGVEMPEEIEGSMIYYFGIVVWQEFTLATVAYFNDYLLRTGWSLGQMDLVPYTPISDGIITFSWTPRHMSSPNSTLSTRYKFELFEINPKADNNQLQAMANNAVQTTLPIFNQYGSYDITATTFVYGPDYPALIEGKQYAWRVRAYDAGGRDWFKNNGYSEVCYFTYGGVPENTPIPTMETVQNFVANGDGERRGTANWNQTNPYSKYKVSYRKKNGTGNWFSVETDSVNTKLYDLEPNTVYEAKVQGKASEFYSPFSNIDTFITSAIAPPPGCGIPINAAAGLSTVPLPNAEATPNIFIKVGKFELQVDSIGNTGGAGYFTGKGRINSIPFLAIVQTIATAMGGNTQTNSGLQVQFTNVFINQNREVTQGDVHAISRSLEEWADGWDDYYEERRKDKQQSNNRRLFSDLDSNAVFLPQFNFQISNVTFDSASNTINIINQNGDTVRVVLNTNQIGHDIVIQGIGNDQWVVKPNGIVAQVPGGGLCPGMNRPISSEEKDYLKRAIVRLKNSSDSTFTQDQNLMQQKSVARKQITDALYSRSNPILAPDYQTIDDGYLGGALYKNETSSPYSIADSAYKVAERKMNIHQVVKLIYNSRENNTILETLARIIVVNEKYLGKYIIDAKAANKSDVLIETEIKNEILVFIDNFLKNNNM